MNTQQQQFNPLINWRLWATPGVISFLLVLLARQQFLAFHALTELFAITLCFVMFVLAWSTRELRRNNFLLFLACGYFWVGSLDLMHSLVYQGMNIFIEGSNDLAVQFWLGSRYFEALVLLGAPFAAGKKQHGQLLMAIFGCCALLLGISILTGSFPRGIIDGQGLTSFKIFSEYLINGILLLALVVLLQRESPILSSEKYLVTASITLTMCAELAFTYHADVSGLASMAVHIFKLLSFWLIFQAILASCLHRPYKALQHKESNYRQLFENSGVSIWNEDFSAVIEQLHMLRQQGVENLGQYLQENKQLARNLSAKTEIIQVNLATLELFGARDREEFFERIDQTFGPDAIDVFIRALVAIWDKRPAFSARASYLTLDGTPLDAIISFRIPESDTGFHSIAVSLTDVTGRNSAG